MTRKKAMTGKIWMKRRTISSRLSILAKFYVFPAQIFFKTYNGERAPYIERCAEIISYAEDSVRIINFTYFQNCLGLTKQALNEILKPYLAKRKSHGHQCTTDGR